MMKLVTQKVEDRKDFELTLDEIAREGARRRLAISLGGHTPNLNSLVRFPRFKEDRK